MCIASSNPGTVVGEPLRKYANPETSFVRHCPLASSLLASLPRLAHPVRLRFERVRLRAHLQRDREREAVSVCRAVQRTTLPAFLTHHHHHHPSAPPRLHVPAPKLCAHGWRCSARRPGGVGARVTEPGAGGGGSGVGRGRARRPCSFVMAAMR